MMNTTQLDAYCKERGITHKARLVIDQVRSLPPTRRVQSGTHNVACRYASKKMGLVIQAESHKNELPAIIGWERDRHTYEFYDQPPKVKLSYVGRGGKPVCYNATPDFFLLQEDFVGWVECKTEEWLQSHVAEGSNLYVQDGNGGWRCPAGEKYADSVDLGFRVRSSSETQWNTIRNLEFLADYLDERCPEPSREALERIQNAMGGQAWIVLKDLLNAVPVDDADALYKMVADGVLYVRLTEDLLSEPERIKVMDAVIDEHYAVKDSWSITACWGEVTNRCTTNSLLPPSQVAFRNQIKRRRQHDLTVAREGEKAAYSDSEFYWLIDSATPRHGERPFEIGHVDHTQLDLQFRGSRRGEKMGKAWLSVLFDAYTRMVLAWVITFDAPSYRTCMALIRACIERHGRIPQTIVVDKGVDFQSIYFETLLARLECHKKTRPASKPRFGSVIERFFGMSNGQFIHCLRGNNVALQKPRSMSKSHDPRELSVWTLPEFREAFDGFLDQVYGEMEHSALGISPKAAMAIGLAQSGLRRHTLIPNTRELMIMCLPSTSKGTAKINPSRGVKIGYIFYWSPAFKDPKFSRTDVPVRYDPYDISVAMVWLKDHWETCQSEYAAVFRGRTEKEIQLISQDIAGQNRNAGARNRINASLIARYLSTTDATEKILQQRQRDKERNKSRI